MSDLQILPNAIRGFALVAIALLSTQACAAARAVAAANAPERYVEAHEYLRTDAQIEAWYRVTAGLRTDFDQVCGDTFCEGDYSNIQSLRYRCSVDRINGRIGQCLWILAGSMEAVDAVTGRIVVSARVWRCRSPVGRLATLEELLQRLDAAAPIRVVLPGSDRSLYDGLVDCMQK